VQDDLVVVGSGVAGLSAALQAVEQGATVTLLAGGALLAGSSPRAQGGVAVALGTDDSPALHAADTLNAGAGLNDAENVALLVHEGREVVRRLLAGGVRFDGTPAAPDLGLEAGHGRHRILHAGGGATGFVLTSQLLEQVQHTPQITVCEQTRVDRLLRDPHDATRVAGAASGERTFLGRAVILATGGYAALWGRTTNGPENRGSGLALAWRVGAALADLELVQFHPTALNLPGRQAFLLTEALRGEGGQLLDASGRAVMDPLLPRDIVARAIHRHLQERGPVFLSLRHLDHDRIRRQFSTLVRGLEEMGTGLDLATDPLPVAPAAHYCMGGIRTDGAGRTSVSGLYAAGEVACTGAQGANRLASNSLLECLVFGARAAAAALADGPGDRADWSLEPLPGPGISSPDAGSSHQFLADPAVLGARLDADLGVERSGACLQRLVDELPDPAAESGCRLASDTLVAALAARGALLRRESRGAHFRADEPEPRSAWRGRIHWRHGQAPRFEPVAAA
jgi:L-aspartate oxidase